MNTIPRKFYDTLLVGDSGMQNNNSEGKVKEYLDLITG